MIVVGTSHPQSDMQQSDMTATSSNMPCVYKKPRCQCCIVKNSSVKWSIIILFQSIHLYFVKCNTKIRTLHQYIKICAPSLNTDQIFAVLTSLEERHLTNHGYKLCSHYYVR